MTREEHALISDAIRMAEKRTAGEIYCVVARSSDSYIFPAASFVSAAIVAISLAVAWLMHRWWYDLDPVMLVAAQLLAIAATLLVLWAFPAIRILLVPRRMQYRHAHDNAVKQFLARNVHITAARTGVLLFVSLAERYAEVVADSGINQKVPQETWDNVVRILSDHARAGRLAEGYVAAVATVGALLAEHFPARPVDRNELDDHLVEI